MSTFMGIAWIDLVPGADPAAVSATYPRLPQDVEGEDLEIEVDALPVERVDDCYRVKAVFDDEQLTDLVAWLAVETELVSHAFIALDHDEYGAEHIILDTHEGAVRRIYHYYAYPRWDDGSYYTDGEPSRVCCRLPGIEESAGGVDPGVLIDGQPARSTVAALYGVPVTAVDEAADRDAVAYRELGTIGGPCNEWREALNLSWPGESDDGWEPVDQVI
ncbi:hypothetical protein [Nocardia carnea]|uniref:hypothetical protein n=1 Tax=Nocardia carnea TaxID=37328 RepID=UPI0024587865|nr:hypothetical protein [Nocardia carnea]